MLPIIILGIIILLIMLIPVSSGSSGSAEGYPTAAQCASSYGCTYESILHDMVTCPTTIPDKDPVCDINASKDDCLLTDACFFNRGDNKMCIPKDSTAPLYSNACYRINGTENAKDQTKTLPELCDANELCEMTRDTDVCLPFFGKGECTKPSRGPSPGCSMSPSYCKSDCFGNNK